MDTGQRKGNPVKGETIQTFDFQNVLMVALIGKGFICAYIFLIEQRTVLKIPVD